MPGCLGLLRGRAHSLSRFVPLLDLGFLSGLYNDVLALSLIVSGAAWPVLDTMFLFVYFDVILCLLDGRLWLRRSFGAAAIFLERLLVPLNLLNDLARSCRRRRLLSIILYAISRRHRCNSESLDFRWHVQQISLVGRNQGPTRFLEHLSSLDILRFGTWLELRLAERVADSGAFHPPPHPFLQTVSSRSFLRAVEVAKEVLIEVFHGSR